MRGFSVIFLFFVLSCGFAGAQQSAAPQAAPDQSALEQKVRDLEDRVVALEGQLRQLKAQAPVPATPPGATAQPSGPETQAQAAGQQGGGETVKLGGAGVA